MESQRTPLTHVEKAVFLTTISLGVLLLLILPLWRRQMEVNPQITLPAPATPSPNAFDFYMKATGETTASEEVNHAIITDFTGLKFPIRLSRGKVLRRPFNLYEKIALLQQNSRALRYLRQGFRYQYQAPQVNSFAAATPYYTEFRQMARLLTLEAQVRSQQGNWIGAANSYIDAMQLGVDIESGADSFAFIVGTGCEAIGRYHLPDIIEHLNAPQIREVIRRLEVLNTRRPSLATSLQQQKVSGQRILMKAFQESDWRDEILQATHNANSHDEWSASRWERMRLEFNGKRAIFSNFSNEMDKLIAQVQQPAADLSTPPSNMFVRYFSLAVNETYFSARRGDTANALVLTAAALQAYQLKNGAWPRSLEELVPTHLKALPRDSFTDNKPLRYRPGREKYVLYSVGPDGKDNGGVPATKSGRNDSIRHFVDATSRGDFVFGINY